MRLGPFGISQQISRGLLRPHRMAGRLCSMEGSKGISPAVASGGTKRMSRGRSSISIPPRNTPVRVRRGSHSMEHRTWRTRNLYQEVLVTPGTHYRFRGYLRTDQISTESGLRFEIFDPKDMKNLDVLTPNETGTQPWTLEETDFTPGPKTHLIRIQLTRTPSKRLDNKLSGTVWVDDVELVPVASKK